MPLREPWARRGEMWDRAAHAAETVQAAPFDHPEMLALIAVQQREMAALMGEHATERIRLALALRDEGEVDELIEASSLGSPGAKALRARAPREVVERIKDAVYGNPPSDGGTEGTIGKD